jgi:threonine dehydratase
MRRASRWRPSAGLPRGDRDAGHHAPLKVDAVQALGGEVVLHGDSYSDAYGHAVELQQAAGLTFVHPFDDPT